MSKCSSCNQALPELRAVRVWVTNFSNTPDMRMSCSVSASAENSNEFETLVCSTTSLMLVPKAQFHAGPSSDWDVHQLACAKQKVDGLRKRNAELVRKLDDVRRAAKL